VNDWLQYTHLEKLYGYLPGMPDALPSVFALTSEEYSAQRAGFEAAVRRTAVEILSDPVHASMVDALPLAQGARILAVGDSVTDDLQSWVEILRHLLELRRPGDEITVVNGGLSAHTTAMVLRRWPATIAAARPDLIVCALGGNDITRVGAGATKTVVSRDESLANLQELRRIAREMTEARWLWMTPVPVIEERIQQYGPFRFGASDWRNDDLVPLSRAISDFPDTTVDLTSVFGVPADPRLQGVDGVHPNLDGQRAIVLALLGTLAENAEDRVSSSRRGDR
jgi:lysophospholipase L1-like esterase